MSAQRLPVALMSEATLRARREELEATQARIVVELRRIDRVLRQTPAPSRVEPAHGTPAGYKAHREIWHTPTCAKCRAWKAGYQRQLRARRRAEHSPNPKEITMPIPNPRAASKAATP